MLHMALEVGFCNSTMFKPFSVHHFSSQTLLLSYRLAVKDDDTLFHVISSSGFNEKTLIVSMTKFPYFNDYLICLKLTYHYCHLCTKIILLVCCICVQFLQSRNEDSLLWCWQTISHNLIFEPHFPNQRISVTNQGTTGNLVSKLHSKAKTFILQLPLFLKGN